MFFLCLIMFLVCRSSENNCNLHDADERNFNLDDEDKRDETEVVHHERVAVVGVCRKRPFHLATEQRNV